MGGRGARVSEFVFQVSKSKMKKKIWWRVGKGLGGRRGGVSDFFYYESKFKNIFWGGRGGGG